MSEVPGASDYTLSGGTLQVNRIVSDAAGTLLLNGGTLQATASSGISCSAGRP